MKIIMNDHRYIGCVDIKSTYGLWLYLYIIHIFLNTIMKRYFLKMYSLFFAFQNPENSKWNRQCLKWLFPDWDPGWRKTCYLSSLFLVFLLELSLVSFWRLWIWIHLQFLTLDILENSSCGFWNWWFCPWLLLPWLQVRRVLK